MRPGVHDDVVHVFLCPISFPFHGVPHLTFERLLAFWLPLRFPPEFQLSNATAHLRTAPHECIRDFEVK